MTRMRLGAIASRLRRDDRGGSMIEFTMIAPLLGFLMLGLADFAMAFSKQIQLEQAAARAIELASAAGASQANYEFVRTEAATAAGEPTANVNLDTWLECDGVRQATYSGTCATSSAQTARYISIQVTSQFTPPFDYALIGSVFGSTGFGGPITLVGDSAVRLQ
jgi:Flp pilus assembly protein TadG